MTRRLSPLFPISAPVRLDLDPVEQPDAASEVEAVGRGLILSVLKALEQSAVWQWLRHKMEKEPPAGFSGRCRK